MHVRWTEEAVADLEEIGNYLELESASAAESVSRVLYEAAESLVVMPFRGRTSLRRPGTRELVVPRTGHIITYEVIGDGVMILNIRHGAQERR